MTTSTVISEFWLSFEKNSRQLARMRTADDPVYDEVLAELQRIDPGLFFEFSAEPGDCELIITAEGDRSLFSLVEAIVAAAPPIEGWKYFALKPKLGFPESVEWEGLKISTADVVFESLETESGELGLRLLVPGIADEEAENAHNALLRALDHGLGEREFAERIGYTEVVPLHGSADEYIALVDLESFIQWRKKRRNP